MRRGVPPPTHLVPGRPAARAATPPSGSRASRGASARAPTRSSSSAALAPDPDLALAGVGALRRRRGRPARGARISSRRSCSSAARRACRRRCSRADPRLLRRAARSPFLARPRTEAELRARPRARGAPARRGRRRRASTGCCGALRAREVVRIALRDLRRARVAEVTGELSALASACIDAAIRFHDRRLRARHGAPAGLEGREPGAGFCALAMGKLGARELNF